MGLGRGRVEVSKQQENAKKKPCKNNIAVICAFYVHSNHLWDNYKTLIMRKFICWVVQT